VTLGEKHMYGGKTQQRWCQSNIVGHNTPRGQYPHFIESREAGKREEARQKEEEKILVEWRKKKGNKFFW